MGTGGAFKGVRAGFVLTEVGYHVKSSNSEGSMVCSWGRDSKKGRFRGVTMCGMEEDAGKWYLGR